MYKKLVLGKPNVFVLKEFFVEIDYAGKFN